MDLFHLFVNKIVALFEIESSSLKEFIGENGLSIGNLNLPFSGVFLAGNDDSPVQGVRDYLNKYEQAAERLNVVKMKDDPIQLFYIFRLHLLNINIEPGFFEIHDADSTRFGVVFTGSLDESIEELDLVDFPETMFALCLLEPSVEKLRIQNWAGIFESIGPFAICRKDHNIETILADSGLFLFENNSFSYEWENRVPASVNLYPSRVPEAEAAYLSALRNSASPDLAFIQLYRVFEILFAFGLKSKISESNIYDVLKTIRSFKNISELSMLSILLEQSLVQVLRFTISDFFELFGAHKPQGAYQRLNDWKISPVNTPLPTEMRATLIYYIRCSLVHSKLGEDEPFLMGPFPPTKEQALARIVEDVRNIVKSLIYP